MKTKIILLAICWFAFSFNANCQGFLEALKDAAKVVILTDADSKSDNTFTRLTGTWTKSQILYPNGTKDWVPYNQQVRISIYPDLNDVTLMGYTFYQPGESEAYEEGKVWFAPGGKICLRKEYTPDDPGLEWQFGTDDRGMECLMIRVLSFSREKVWIMYEREL